VALFPSSSIKPSCNAASAANTCSGLPTKFSKAWGNPSPTSQFPAQQLLEHRSWSNAELARLLAHARHEDHIEPETGPDFAMIHLSEPGFGEASRITRNHRLWELYLITHADIAPSHVDRDADLVEHILGAEMVRALEAELPPRSVIPKSPHHIEVR